MRKEHRVMNHISILIIAVIIVAICFTPVKESHARGQSPFVTVMERVAVITANNDWKEQGWQDLELEASLSLIINRVGELTKDENVQIPVSFDSVYPLFDGDRGGTVENRIIVKKSGNISHAKNSIIIADESIDVANATNCLIIARGLVDVSSGSGNVIIAGHYIEVSHDGNSRPNPDGQNKSVLISGSTVDMSFAVDSIICAPQRAKVSSAKGVTLINTPNVKISSHKDSIYLTDEQNILPEPSEKPNWIDKLKITQIVSGSKKKALVITKHTGVETLMRIGDTIPKASGDFKGWKLMAVEGNFVLFEKDNQYASTTIDR